MTPKELLSRSDKLFGKRGNLLSLWQEIADNFYPERGQFTTRPWVGERFADHLSTSYPILVRRDLGDAVATMLRPRDRDWFFTEVEGIERLDSASQQYLEWMTKIERRAFYDTSSGFVRATKEGDHDFVTFGQPVISLDMNNDLNGLLFRSWHLKDCAWVEDYTGIIDEVHRVWKPFLRDVAALYPGRLHSTMQNAVEREPYREVELRHIVMKSADYHGAPKRQPFVSIVVDVENQHILEEVGSWILGYIIPRWKTVSGSQYGYSPATISGLPDARLLQSISLTLQEAGEKAVDPPLVGYGDAIRGDLNIAPGGFTSIDRAYDERLGEAVRELYQTGSRNFPFGFELQQDVREMLSFSGYIDKLRLPPPADRERTAYEVSQIVTDNARHLLPLFEPMEFEYNGALVEQANILLRVNGGFGPPDLVPEQLRGRELTFRFVSPIQESRERLKVQQFMEVSQIVAAGAGVDPSLAVEWDARKAIRDAIQGSGAPASWLREEEESAAILEQQAQQAQMAQMAEMLEKGGGAVEKIGRGAKAIREAG
jgi:hypothetical protein